MENNQEQLAPQPVPSELPPSQKPALLKWLLIALLFSLAVLGGVLYVQNTNKSQISTVVPTQIPQITPSPTPDVTANWKTYTNTTYQYSLRYPKEWILKETPQTTYFFPPETTPEINTNTSITIQVTDKTKTPPPPNTRTYEKIRSSFLGLEKVDVLKSGVETGIKYIVLTEKNKYSFYIAFGSELETKYETLYDQILSTFKFLDQP